MTTNLECNITEKVEDIIKRMKKGHEIKSTERRLILQDIHRLKTLSGESSSWLYTQGITEELLPCDDPCVQIDLVRYVVNSISGEMDRVNGLQPGFFPKTYTLKNLIYNGIEYAADQTLTINSIDDVEIGVGFNGKEYVTNACDWVNSIINNQFPLTFYDEFRYVDRPADSTFILAIHKTSSHNGQPSPNEFTYLWTEEGWFGYRELGDNYLQPYVEVP